MNETKRYYYIKIFICFIVTLITSAMIIDLLIHYFFISRCSRLNNLFYIKCILFDHDGLKFIEEIINLLIISSPIVIIIGVPVFFIFEKSKIRSIYSYLSGALITSISIYIIMLMLSGIVNNILGYAIIPISIFLHVVVFWVIRFTILFREFRVIPGTGNSGDNKPIS